MPAVAQPASQHLAKSVTGFCLEFVGQLRVSVLPAGVGFEQGKGHLCRLECLLRQVAGIVPATSIAVAFAVVVAEYVGMAFAVYPVDGPAAPLTIDEVQYLLL